MACRFARIAVLAALLGTALSQGFAEAPPGSVARPINLLPPELHHDRPARNAKEQYEWDEAVFAHYETLVTDYSEYDHRRAILNSPLKRRYATQLRTLRRKLPQYGINVAVVKIPCGAHCITLGMEVLGDGKTFVLEHLVGGKNVRADYRLDSMILRVMGDLGGTGAADRWFLLDRYGFKLVYQEPMSAECFAVKDDPEIGKSAACKFVALTADPYPLLH